MNCASPNQWALTSPTTSSSSRSSRLRLVSDEVANEEQETDDQEMLDHVRQLIVDLLVDDDRRSSVGLEQTGGGKHRSNNPEAEDEGSARERLLEDKLARVLMDLAGEQDNLRLAANAGNALLEELRTAREEIDTLHDELEAVQLDRDRCVRDAQRLRDQNAALETALQRYDPFGDSTSHMQLQRRPSLPSRSGSFSRTDSCERCASREVEVTQLEQRADELRRRCLELELAREREQQRQRELTEQIEQLHQRNKEQQVETTRAQQDLESVAMQLDQQSQEVERVQAVRDSLRRTTRRLEVENEELRERLEAREELVTKLENSKARAATQLQVAENRTASAQAEAKRVTEALEQLQKQLEHSGRGSSTGPMESQEKQTEDMEQLLEDASREVTALRLENRILRRQSSAETGSDATRTRARRRKTMCTGSSAMTAADVLALGTRSSSNKSDSGSEIEFITTPRSQLPPLEIEDIKSAQTEAGDDKKRRKMPLELNWVDKAATCSVATAAPPPLEEKPRTLPVPSVSEKKKLEDDQLRPTALSRLSHVNDHCVISGAIEVNSPDVIDGKRISRLPIDELRREAAESPPKSPLYLGLSFIACATAATAAGLLVRR
ncbi:hypothetical protein JG687_00002824 [Phytophthora cactorum]|uniref:Uncharacterized protein n=1 Tax=Phytophthora cactorum TaxID=29920 RepID=A0A329SYQ1_9STRA|nr:hypothetical protein Pcac1_g21558 [Phytophthora cactorum]KAG2828079.1 hypothetical protein PC112_g8607 [Phytophthora cactorum]KAG2834196.1 hypothetical protein PC111_g5912 [Phytophthora cactorum]KAG2863363.1 hypothetical protein PC113_g5505 [Phytophthora cactorum]KAG2910563.1 hypothetical protein PC114_g9707 [Phytophthora cactorum]